MHKEISFLAMKFLDDFAQSILPQATFLIEDETKDEAQLFKAYYESNRAWDNLLDLGFVEDIRSLQGPHLDTLEQRTGRKFRVFQLTEHGRMFNDPRASAWRN